MRSGRIISDKIGFILCGDASYYSDGVRRDLVAQKAFWVPYQGKTNEVSNKVNDAYLKSNRQTDGVASYGRMVDWVIAYHLNEKNTRND